MPHLTLRVAQAHEFAEIAAMHVAAWKKAYETLIKPTCLDQYGVAGFEEHYQTLLAQGYTFAIAESNGAVLGMTIFHERSGEIDALYVEPSSWRHSIGTQLLRYVLDSTTADDVLLECAKANQRGCGFWEDSGFDHTGEGEAFDPQCDAPIPTWRLKRRRHIEDDPLARTSEARPGSESST